MPNRNIYEPVENDNISRGFDALGLIPEKFRGKDDFLDIVTWNIRYFHHYDTERLERISQILSVLNADIIVLQEILHGALEPVAQRLAALGAGYYQVEYGTTGGNQRVAIMWDLDWIRTKDDVKEIVKKKEVISTDGKDAFPRLPLWGYFTALSQLEGYDPFDFQLVGLHLKSQRGGGGPQREKAGNWLANWLKNGGENLDADVIMIGDWNAKPSAKVWSDLQKMEDDGEVKFKSINNETDISHLYYKNKKNIGSRLDLATISIAAVEEVVDAPEIVRWKPLDDFLDTSPKAKEIKKFLKEISTDISDHMPVITRFYFEEQG
jgi:endonuclease/exonuclease/phosphatase family metal-dependent hydrolase